MPSRCFQFPRNNLSAIELLTVLTIVVLLATNNISKDMAKRCYIERPGEINISRKLT